MYTNSMHICQKVAEMASVSECSCMYSCSVGLITDWKDLLCLEINSIWQLANTTVSMHLCSVCHTPSFVFDFRHLHPEKSYPDGVSSSLSHLGKSCFYFYLCTLKNGLDAMKHKPSFCPCCNQIINLVQSNHEFAVIKSWIPGWISS